MRKFLCICAVLLIAGVSYADAGIFRRGSCGPNGCGPSQGQPASVIQPSTQVDITQQYHNYYRAYHSMSPSTQVTMLRPDQFWLQLTGQMAPGGFNQEAILPPKTGKSGPEGFVPPRAGEAPPVTLLPQHEPGQAQVQQHGWVTRRGRVINHEPIFRFRR